MTRAKLLILLTTLLLSASCQQTRARPTDSSLAGDSVARRESPSPDEWPAYGRDAGGARHSPLTQVNRTNVARLEIAWTFRTGDMSDGSHYPKKSNFEATPIFRFGTLYVSTPFNRVIALDPETGVQRWAYDPKVNLSVRYSESLVSRGVSSWEDAGADARKECRRRIFLGTIDARLIALDAATGTPCADFGDGGQVDLTRDVGQVARGEYGVTSPPAVVHDLVVIGSAAGDNRGVDLERGTVRGFDARTGALRWSWDPVPRGEGEPGWDSWDAKAALRARAANAWSIISADPARDLVFIPTGTVSPDYYGGERPGKNLHANSVVALRASTGRLVWAFQVVHHDLWDYDVPAEPALITVRRDGKEIAAVAVATKMGHLFVLDRETGAPLDPIEEREVPPSTVAGEVAWPTQPFPVTTPNLIGSTQFIANDVWGITASDREACRSAMRGVRAEGIFTPPSLEGTIVFPSALGGTNWGGVAADNAKGILVTAVNRLAQVVELIPRAEMPAARKAGSRFGAELSEQRGTPYGMSRHFLFSPGRLPCNAPPWGALVAVDLETGKVRWRVPLGAIPALRGQPGTELWGSIVLGGPIVTDGGLVFVAGTMDNYLRAFDVETGAELWKGELPAGGQATPMTYRATSGKQFVIIAAGGHGGLGTTLGDHVVAFALP